jgi:hypothetical protein
MLLSRPDAHAWAERKETINDFDGFVANFWRAVAKAPDEVAQWADWPANENDMMARHVWLVARKETLRPQLEGDPDWYDPKVAGWWLYGICLWIGGGWCRGGGPWCVDDGKLLHLGNAGQGINRQLLHLGDAGLCDEWSERIRDMMRELRDRLRRVRVCCGDWERVCGPSPCFPGCNVVGVFLDPPYSDAADRTENIYAEDDLLVAHRVREWCVEHGTDTRYRIALCGYEGEHELPGWDVYEWKAVGGYYNLGNADCAGMANAKRERIWFSPGCLREADVQLSLFGREGG